MIAVANHLAVLVDVVRAVDDVGGSRAHLVACHRCFLLYFQFLEGSLLPDMQVINGQRRTARAVVSRQPVARVGNTIARIVRALHQIAVERGDISRHGTQDATHRQVATHRERVRRLIVLIFAEEFVFSVLLQVTGCHHQCLGVHKLVGCVCRGHTRQFLVAEYQVVERSASLHGDVLQERHHLAHLRINIPF